MKLENGEEKMVYTAGQMEQQLKRTEAIDKIRNAEHFFVMACTDEGTEMISALPNIPHEMMSILMHLDRSVNVIREAFLHRVAEMADDKGFLEHLRREGGDEAVQGLMEIAEIIRENVGKGEECDCDECRGECDPGDHFKGPEGPEGA